MICFLGYLPRLLKDNARTVRRLSEQGELKYHIAKNSSQYSSIIESSLIQKESRYLLTGTINILSDYNVKLFYKGLFENLGQDINVHLSVMSLNNEFMATHLGVVYKNRFYYLFPTFCGR